MAEGFLRIAVDNMANAIKKISVQRGHDVTGYTLQCFGGAGGQHACLVADALGMTQGADPPARRVFSVCLRHGPWPKSAPCVRSRWTMRRWPGPKTRPKTALDKIADEARAEVAGQGIEDITPPAPRASALRRLSPGALDVPFGAADADAGRFRGHPSAAVRISTRPNVQSSLICSASKPSARPARPPAPPCRMGTVSADGAYPDACRRRVAGRAAL